MEVTLELVGAAFGLMGATCESVGVTVSLVGAGAGLALEESCGAEVGAVMKK